MLPSFLSCGLIVAVVVLIRRFTRRTRPPLPPSPHGWPLIGNVFQVPYKFAWSVYRDWSKELGSDIIQLRFPRTSITVLNSFDVAIDLLENRSSIYSDRPHSIMVDDLAGFGWSMVSTKYGRRFREMRKMIHHEFKPEGVKRWQGVQTQACYELLRNLLHSPEDFTQAIRHMVGRVIMQVTYGFDIEREGDAYIQIAERALRVYSAAANAGANLVDNIPALRFLPEWFPGAVFQAHAKEWKFAASLLLNEPFEAVKSRICEGIATSLLESIDTSSEDAHEMESIAQATLASMYGAGVDTTVGAVSWFILAMVLYPEVQAKAQEEIDRIVGSDRLPTFLNFESLPYVHAVATESLRWHPAVPIAAPHCLMENDVYEGCFIPKGSIVIGNIHVILHDEEMYPEPSRFNPDRYFQDDGQWNAEVRDPCFGCIWIREAHLSWEIHGEGVSLDYYCFDAFRVHL